MSKENRIDIGVHRQEGRGRKAFWIVLGILFVVGALWMIDGGRRDSSYFFTNSIASERTLNRALNVLDATAEQRATIEPALRGLQSDMVEMREEETRLRIEFFEALSSGTLRPEDVGRLQTAATGLSEVAIGRALEVTSEVWGVLTPEQRTELLNHWDPRS